MNSFATAPAANGQIASVRILPSDRRLPLVDRHRVATGQQTGEARSLVSHRRQRYQFRCCNGSTTINSREHTASLGASDWTSSRSVSDGSLATVFRWPGAFGSQAVSVLGNKLLLICGSQHRAIAIQSFDVAAGQVPLTTGRILFLFRSRVEPAIGLSVSWPGQVCSRWLMSSSCER